MHEIGMRDILCIAAHVAWEIYSYGEIFDSIPIIMAIQLVNRWPNVALPDYQN